MIKTFERLLTIKKKLNILQNLSLMLTQHARPEVAFSQPTKFYYTDNQEFNLAKSFYNGEYRIHKKATQF